MFESTKMEKTSPFSSHREIRDTNQKAENAETSFQKETARMLEEGILIVCFLSFSWRIESVFVSVPLVCRR